MADEVMRTSLETDAITPEIWSEKFYDVLLAQLPFNSVINKDYEGEIQARGDTVHISTVPEFGDATEFSEDQKVDASAVTVTGQNLVINRQIAKDFILTKKAMLQSLPIMDKLRDLAIYSIMKKMEQILIASSIPSAANPDHSIAYDSGTTLALADILEVKELLDLQDVPMENRFMVVGAAQLNDIFNITGFTSSDFLVSGAPLVTGQLPAALLGFLPKFTTLVGNTSYWAHSSYLTMASQQGMDVQIYDLGVEGKRAARVNVDVLFGEKLLDNTRLVTLA